MNSSIRFSEQRPSQTASLSCANCSHASPVNGSWIIEVHRNSLGYECPVCGTTIDSRHDTAALRTQSSGSLQFEGEN